MFNALKPSLQGHIQFGSVLNILNSLVGVDVSAPCSPFASDTNPPNKSPATDAPVWTHYICRIPPFGRQGLSEHRDLDDAHLAHKFVDTVRIATRSLFGGS